MALFDRSGAGLNGIASQDLPCPRWFLLICRMQIFMRTYCHMQLLTIQRQQFAAVETIANSIGNQNAALGLYNFNLEIGVYTSLKDFRDA